MPVSTNTPQLDLEILKLRRSLGDTYTEDGNLIVNDTASSYYVGNTSFNATWNSAELLDCYNTACIKFIEYLVKVIDKSLWHKYIRGYIIRKLSVTHTGGAVNLDSLTPSMWIPVDLAIHSPSTINDIGVEIPPSEYFFNLTAAIKTRQKQLLFVFLNDATNNVIQFFNYGAATTFDLVYVKQHIDFIHDSSTVKDVTVFTKEGLERVRIIAEKVAQRFRSSEVRDLPDADEQLATQLDLTPERK